jgi:hypothetical protein
MSAISPEIALRQRAVARNPLGPLATLARRRFQLTASRPRELLVPLVTPILFALVIAPALKTALHTSVSYEAFVATGTIGLLIPLNTMFAGLSVIVDRHAGAQRELLSAPIPRPLLPLSNLLVALATTTFQIAVLLGVAEARQIHLHITAGGFLWFFGASLFFTRFLPLTHGLALVRYGLLNDPTALHDIWGMHSTSAMAGLSLLVVAAFAALLTRAATRIFAHSAIQ